MGEHAIVHLPVLTATVPVGTQETTARPEVCIVQTPSTVGPRKVQLVLLYLQTVVQPVRTEELVMVHTCPLTVSVPVGTQETTARTEVCNSTQP